MTAPRRLAAADLDPVVDCLADSFSEYPVMRFVLGDTWTEERNRALVRIFVANRVYREDAIFGIEEEGRLVAALTTTDPEERDPSPELAPLRERLWTELGPACRARYARAVEVWQTFVHPPPHFHVNMVGVRREPRGRGHARRLMEAAHALSAAHPASTGVSLTTETAANVPFYEKLGYRAPGPVRIAEGFETWDFFRPEPGRGSPTDT